MTKKELNLKVAALWRKYCAHKQKPYNTDAEQRAYHEGEQEIAAEVKRLWDVDREAEYLNLKSLKILALLNTRLRAISLHQFALYFKIDE